MHYDNEITVMHILYKGGGIYKCYYYMQISSPYFFLENVIFSSFIGNIEFILYTYKPRSLSM